MIGRIIAASVALLAGAASAQEPTLPFVLKQVGPGVYAAIDGPEHKAGSNAGFVIGDDGVLVVDALFTPDAARALVAEIRRLTPKPIRYVVNTHYHLDHTGGDQVFRDAGAIIVAHSNVRTWVRTNNVNLFGDRITPEIRTQIEGLPLPDLTTDKDLTIWLGSRKVVDFDGKELSEKQLAAKYGVKFTPTIQFFPDTLDEVKDTTPQKREIIRIPGYLKPDDFLDVFRFVQQKSYGTKTFREFLKSERS